MARLQNNEFDWLSILENKKVVSFRKPTYEEEESGYENCMFIIIFADGTKLLVSADDTGSELAVQHLDKTNEILDEDVWELR